VHSLNVVERNESGKPPRIKSESLKEARGTNADAGLITELYWLAPAPELLKGPAKRGHFVQVV